jgi:hypothetical protein
MMLKLVLPGSSNCEGELMVSKSRPRTFTEEQEGFTAIGVILCERYQAKIWWPNLDGFEDAPATAIRGEDMKVRAAVCMVGSVVGMACGGVRVGLAVVEEVLDLDSSDSDATRLDGDPVHAGWI